MKRETEEWLHKAEGDLRTAGREAAHPAAPNHDAACYHAQQAAEKFLKAGLCEAGLKFPRPHDLEALYELMAAGRVRSPLSRIDLLWLTTIGVEVRYPGRSSDGDDSARAVAIAAKVRADILAGLGISS